MIKRLLIANRGEIAVRIASACRELGIESVAVFSEADVRARHVEAADWAVPIGPAPAADSYLSIEHLIAAARQSSADAVHPGYGFLSEAPGLAEACEGAGLVFVGPPSSVIRRMGSKIEARRVMQSAGIAVVPGETPQEQSDDGVRRSIERVGFPALVKASAGGGGKGMRQVNDPADVAEAVSTARREAQAAFGDGTLYVERRLAHPRHVEVQVFGDHHGHVIHLFERECSAQRQHQKVIEESPSPAVTPELRRRLTETAVQAARMLGYRNAGTVEFLLEADAERFYFLEMNTRLQVEHPVTEAVTGLDLVQGQLLVAAGGSLPWLDRLPVQRGHAIEARVYAEDPTRDFVPQAGRVLFYREPRLPGVRIDAGIRQGSDIPIYYDALLAKAIAYAESRDQARRRLLAALRDFPILGVSTNLPLLVDVLEHPRFVAGEVDISFLDTETGSLLERSKAPAPDFVLAAAGTAEDESASEGRSDWDPWERLRTWRQA